MKTVQQYMKALSLSCLILAGTLGSTTGAFASEETPKSALAVALAAYLAHTIFSYQYFPYTLEQAEDYSTYAVSSIQGTETTMIRNPSLEEQTEELNQILDAQEEITTRTLALTGSEFVDCIRTDGLNTVATQLECQFAQDEQVKLVYDLMLLEQMGEEQANIVKLVGRSATEITNSYLLHISEETNKALRREEGSKLRVDLYRKSQLPTFFKTLDLCGVDVNLLVPGD